VIVPVYNVEEWLGECLASLVGQSIDDWECVVVIDGSPDGSEEIARGWADGDPRISVVSVPNGGLGAARNIGLRQASGKWVFFLDSDDELPPRALELLRDAAEADQADIVIGTGVDFFLNKTEQTYWAQTGTLHRSRSGGLTVSSTPELLNDHVAWNKLYRRSFIETDLLLFTAGVHCEDLLFSARALTSAKAVSIIPEVVYRHRRHESAISADYLRAKTLVDWMEESAKAIDFLTTATDSNVIDHYVHNFIGRQWWTRMAGFDRIGSQDLVTQFEEFSARLLGDVTQDARLKYRPLILACLEFAAGGGLTRRWIIDGVGLNPLKADLPSRIDGVRVTLQAIEQLELTDLVEIGLAGALLIELASLPLMRHGAFDQEAIDLKDRIDSIARVLDARQFVGYLRNGADVVDSTILPVEVLNRVLAEREPLVATLRHATVTARSIALRGSVRVALAGPRVTKMWIVLRSQTSTKVRAVPTWWTAGADDDLLLWSAAIALTEDTLGEQWKCWIRVQRGAWPPSDAVLDNKLNESASRLESTGLHDLLPVVVVFIRSAIAMWSAERQIFPSSGVVLRALDQTRAAVFTFPKWQSNPYLVMLLLEARARGFPMEGSTDPSALIAELSDARSNRVVHLHWTSPITEGAANEAEAYRRVGTLIASVKRAVARGRTVVWTVHNTLPHDTKYPDAARRLHRELAGSVSSIHMLSEQTPSAVAHEFAIPPDRTVVIPHSSYYGVYGSWLPRAKAQAALGARTDATSILFFGQVRPYKGLENLLGAVERLADAEDPFQLLVAGKPSPEASELIVALEQAPVAVTAALRFIEDDEVSTWFSAADVLVAPYRYILNSGTMHLAATFGVPTVLPGLDHLRKQFGDESWVRFFDTDDPSSSIAEVLRSHFYSDEDNRLAAREFARRYTPLRMARTYADYLDGLGGSRG
jgi:glycosyltransferase involved in cell wall biosynthesis